ncbi:MAG: FHA domain-containing protein [Chloroflexi bacterium]|nr:FHA domain-containing protein [Chloroflexota bacterium]
MGAQYILQIRTEKDRVYEQPLRDGAISIGRQPDNDVVLDHASVSGHHLRIETAPPGAGAPFMVVDLGSRGGTLLRGQRLAAHTPVPLLPEAPLTIGPYALRLVPHPRERPTIAAPHALSPQTSSSSSSSSSPVSQWLWMLAAAGFTLALISLLLNVVLIAKLGRVASVGREIVTEMEGAFDDLNSEGITLDVEISQSIPISVSVPIDEVFNVDVEDNVTIDKVVQTEVTIPVVNRSVLIDIPIRATLPLDEIVPVHFQETIRFNEEIPVELSVPIHLDPEALGLGPLMEKIQGWMAQLRDVF